uniref:Uncharacterized protein n=1 Tax=Anguilla anguilla TaxID=7936 RepID=A0A0E9UCS0_ANGAN
MYSLIFEKYRKLHTTNCFFSRGLNRGRKPEAITSENIKSDSFGAAGRLQVDSFCF